SGEPTAPLATVDAPSAVAQPAPVASAAAQPAPVASAAEVTNTEVPRRAASGPSPAPHGTLALEVGVLGSVRSALRAGEPARALALLDAHRGTFARGMLREEFLAARVMALRALGRPAEAAAEAARFAAEMPHSPLATELASPADESEPLP